MPQISVDALNVTSNNTYTPSTGHAYGPVTVNVPQTVVEALSVTSNNTYTASEGHAYNPVTVNVPQTVVESLSVTSNNTYTPSEGHAYGPVTVNVPQTTVESLNVDTNGTYTASEGHAYSPVVVNVSGGGTTIVPEKDVTFYDYDGTPLYSYTAQEALALTELPANPTHDGLTSQGWNYTLQEIKSNVNSTGKVSVGQMYVTNNGKTRLYCYFVEGRLSPTVNVGVKGSVDIDWGDGSSTDTLTGTSLTTTKSKQHTYTSEGEYVITLTVTSGSINIYGTSDLSRIITTNIQSYARIYQASLKKVELGSSVTIGNYAFAHCYQLSSITMPHEITDIGNYAFNLCYCLKFITIPDNVTTIGNNVFSGAYLKSISLSNKITTLSGQALYNTYMLKRVDLPNSLTTIGSQAISGMSSLSELIIPESVVTFQNSSSVYGNPALVYVRLPENMTDFSGITSCSSLSKLIIPNYSSNTSSMTFSGNYSMKEYHFEATTPPQLSSNGFNYIPSDCIIYVPSESLETYKTASNWSSYASKMVGE